MSEFITPAPRADLRWLAVDLDGTIAEHCWTPENPTSEIGKPLVQNVGKLLAAVSAGWKVAIHTSRAWTDYEGIKLYLEHHKIPFNLIVCGKLLAMRYVDDRSIHANDSSWIPGEGPHD